MDLQLLGIVVVLLLAAGGVIMGYGMLNGRVRSLEEWKQVQERVHQRIDDELNTLLQVSATNTANIAHLTVNITWLTSHCDLMHSRLDRPEK